MVCLQLWTCHQSFSDTPGVAGTGDLGAVILFGPVTNPYYSLQLSFPFLVCEVVLVAWGRGSRKRMWGLGTDETISKLLFNLENILIGFYFKFCVLEWWQSHVWLGGSAGALGAIHEGEPGQAGRDMSTLLLLGQSSSNLTAFSHQGSLGKLRI